MPFVFSEDLRIHPLPLDAKTAGVLARHFAEGIAAAGGRQQAAGAAVDAIYALSVDALPSERTRLQLLYRQAYSRAELERLTLDTFEAVGL